MIGYIFLKNFEEQCFTGADFLPALQIAELNFSYVRSDKLGRDDDSSRPTAVSVCSAEGYSQRNQSFQEPCWCSLMAWPSPWRYFMKAASPLERAYSASSTASG